MEQSPLLSVVVSVYNHGGYIEECLRSIASQKVDFPFEVLVGEDCSTDDSREVLRRLEPELPDCFTILYREHNMGAVANGEDLYARARGRYLVDFEGDDFFTYDGKLAEQLRFLEGHPDHSAVYTNCLVVDALSRPNGERYPECVDDEYSYRENFYYCLPGQSGTLMCRREEYFAARDRFNELKGYDFYPGDRRNAFLFLTMGKVRCVQERWSAYRHVRKGGSSYSATRQKDAAFARNEVLYGKALLDYALRYGDEEAQSWARLTCYRLRFKWSHGSRRVERMGEVLRDALREKSPLSLVLAQPRWYAGLLARVLRGRSINL
ncbi:glycosyltransferase [Olsenella sp. oral taxon 809]|uniref:glycosyltransferase family 2 protein n=1 Tax=Olsenella sp. oral taxon 809 TaxID=661086 RepID=UPI000231EE24|nr:glycosyltransferase [Olsenella sp. oral taxon 809]EHF01594.1 hypothetical protein HMPREF1008_01218 [Olsenella sp. oral taxon 809 str. F0356]